MLRVAFTQLHLITHQHEEEKTLSGFPLKGKVHPNRTQKNTKKYIWKRKYSPVPIESIGLFFFFSKSPINICFPIVPRGAGRRMEEGMRGLMPSQNAKWPKSTPLVNLPSPLSNPQWQRECRGRGDVWMNVFVCLPDSFIFSLAEVSFCLLTILHNVQGINSKGFTQVTSLNIAQHFDNEYFFYINNCRCF